MPGKKKTKPKRRKQEVVAEPDAFDLMDREQLKGEVVHLSKKLTKIRRDRNFYLLERNQFQEFYNIVHTEVNRTDSHIRNIEAQMERMQDTHRNDIRIYLQKVIHLEYEHANNVDKVQGQAAKQREQEETLHGRKKAQLKAMKLRLKSELDQEGQRYEEDIKSLKENESKEMLKLREGFERKHQELVATYDTRLENLRDDLELHCKMEIHEIEERKNSHVNDLMNNHDKAFTLMRQYYNAITQDNLALIKSLRDEKTLLRAKHEENEQAMEEITKRNELLNNPLEEAEEQVRLLREKLKCYQKDKESLKHARSRLVILEDQYKGLCVQQTLLQQNYNQVEKERDGLLQTFEDTVQRIRTKSEVKNNILQDMLDECQNSFETKKSQFGRVLRASNLDPVVLQNVTKKLDDVLSAKNDQIRELKYECAKVTKAHNDLVRIYEDRLRTLGIPDEELNLEPLIELNPEMAGAGNAPADLIVL